MELTNVIDFLLSSHKNNNALLHKEIVDAKDYF